MTCGSEGIWDEASSLSCQADEAPSLSCKADEASSLSYEVDEASSISYNKANEASCLALSYHCGRF